MHLPAKAFAMMHVQDGTACRCPAPHQMYEAFEPSQEILQPWKSDRTTPLHSKKKLVLRAPGDD